MDGILLGECPRWHDGKLWFADWVGQTLYTSHYEWYQKPGNTNQGWVKYYADRIDLSDREVECLTWAARGKTSAEIAQIIGTSKRNVDFHIETACRKLDVVTRVQAAVKAVSGRLIDP